MEKKVVIIGAGSGSTTIADKLKEAGLSEDRGIEVVAFDDLKTAAKEYIQVYEYLKDTQPFIYQNPYALDDEQKPRDTPSEMEIKRLSKAQIIAEYELIQQKKNPRSRSQRDLIIKRYNKLCQK